VTPIYPPKLRFWGYKNKGKICQIKESAQVLDESDTDNKDSTKIKTVETEAPISRKITIMDLRQSRSKKTREYDSDEYGSPPAPSPRSRPSRHSTPPRPSRPSTPPRPDPTSCGEESSSSDDGHHAPHGTPPYRCSSSDNNETQISRMDKIIAQGNVLYVPRRNRPAPPPPDVLEL
jgi:hypothetical protein